MYTATNESANNAKRGIKNMPFKSGTTVQLYSERNTLFLKKNKRRKLQTPKRLRDLCSQQDLRSLIYYYIR